MNTTTITKALQAARECIHADRTSFADCSIGPGNTMEPDDAEALAEYDAVLAQVDEALAALQPQPAAAVSDEQIRDALESAFLGEPGKRNLADDLRVARAVLTRLRPQAVPMTEGERLAIAERYCTKNWTDNYLALIDAVIADVQAHHRITAQGAQGEQG